MNKDISIARTFYWRRPFASAYFRSAGSYLLLKLSIFIMAGLAGQYLLTHYLAREDYGLLIWVGTIIALLSPFGLPGISTSITGAVARGYDGNFRRGTWLEMAGGTVGGLVLLGFASYYWFWKHEEIKALMFVVAGVLGPGLWLDTHQCYWNGKKNFRALFWWAVPVRLAQLIATAIVLYFSLNPVWVFSVQTFIQVVANIGAVLGIMKIGGINKGTSKEYASYGWFSNYLYIFGIISSQIDKAIIGGFFGLEKLAVFAIGELIYNYLFIIPKTFFDQIFFPRFAEMRLKEVSLWVRKRQPYLIIGTGVCLCIISLMIPLAYRTIFSVKYNESIFFAYLFLLNVFVNTPVLFGWTILRSHCLKRESVIGQIIVSLTPVLLIPPFIFLWGLSGVIFARISQGIILSVYFTYFVIKKSK